jgi:hypothetical protein
MEGESSGRCAGGVGLMACDEDGEGEGREREGGRTQAQLVGPLTIDDNDDRWSDLFLASDEDSDRDTSY